MCVDYNSLTMSVNVLLMINIDIVEMLVTYIGNYKSLCVIKTIVNKLNNQNRYDRILSNITKCKLFDYGGLVYYLEDQRHTKFNRPCVYCRCVYSEVVFDRYEFRYLNKNYRKDGLPCLVKRDGTREWNDLKEMFSISKTSLLGTEATAVSRLTPNVPNKLIDLPTVISYESIKKDQGVWYMLWKTDKICFSTSSDGMRCLYNRGGSNNINNIVDYYNIITKYLQ